MYHMIEDDLRIAPSVERWSETSAYRAFVNSPHIGSIVVVKADHIGDFILSLDAIVCLRQSFPEARIDLVCAPWNLELARSLGLFERIYTVALFGARADSEHPAFQLDMVAGFRGERYDLAIDLRTDPDTRVILRHITATYKAGFDSPDHRDIMTMFLPYYVPSPADTNIGMHQTMMMLRLARSVGDLFKRTDDVKSLLLSRAASPAEIDLSMARDRFLVVCNTSSGRAAKNWPPERFRRLIRWLVNNLDVVVLLLGGADQMAEANEIIQFSGSAAVISAVGKTSIGEAVDLIRQASLFVGNDSALTHVAARLGVPTVALFSGIDPTVMWAALGENATVLRAPVPCSPCHILYFRDCHGEHACMLNITEASVRAAVRKHLFTARRFGQAGAASAPDRLDVREHPMFREWASSAQARPPQRYGENHPRYVAHGGELCIEHLMQGYTADNKSNRGDLNRFYMFMLVFDQIIKERIYGDIAELGVYKGNTAVMLASLARQLGVTAYLLDTFAGFESSDLHGVDSDKEAAFADTSLETVQALVGTANTHFIQGYFPSTAGDIPETARFCLVHIDCDLYVPFKAALEFFYDRLEPGGFLIMHDYASLHWNGVERAVDAFFADKPESVMPMPDAAGTVIVRKAKRPDHRANWLANRQASGFANAWCPAMSADTGSCLVSGWAAPEPWGVWGLGAVHVLVLALVYEPEGDLELAVESTTPLLKGRERQSIAVVVAGETLADWIYTPEHNKAVRLVRVPRHKIRLEDGLPVLRVEFRPASVLAPYELDPDNVDDRPLGLGLIRFRQRPLVAGRMTAGGRSAKLDDVASAGLRMPALSASSAEGMD